MDKNSADLMVGTLTSLIAERMAEAASLAKAADACAREGNAAGAVQIVLDVEEPVFEAQTLMNAAALIHRLAREDR